MNASASRRRFGRLGIVLAASLVSLGMIEVALRVVGFEFHLYPAVEFGYPDPQQLENNFEPHDEFLWVKKDYDQRLERARANPPHLVLMGCSCTDWGKYDAEILRLWYETPGAPPLSLSNFGCAGWSTYQGLQQMKRDVVPLAPDVVTIFYGWNDHWIGFGVEDKNVAKLAGSSTNPLLGLRTAQLVTKAMVGLQAEEGRESGAGARPKRVALPDFRSNLEQMVDLALANDITPVLMTAPTSHRRGEEPEYLAERWLEDLQDLVPLHQSYAAVVREVATEKGVVLCDLMASIDAMPRRDSAKLFKPDGIHYTPAGGTAIGRLVYECLDDNDLLPKR
jgi:lysophospholipase L1-like esterase